MKEVNGETHEPFEDVTIDCDEIHSGAVIEKLNIRGGDMRDLRAEGDGRARMRWIIPSRGLIGYRNDFLTDTRGSGTISHIFSHYAKEKARRRRRANGVIIVQDPCTTAGYALDNLQDRGVLFVGPVVEMYAGQVLGIHSRDRDLIVNPAKGKKLTNVRSSGTDDAIRLIPPRLMTLEDSLEFIAEDELVECTPKSVRIRKRILDHNERKRTDKA